MSERIMTFRPNKKCGKVESSSLARFLGRPSVSDKNRISTLSEERSGKIWCPGSCSGMCSAKTEFSHATPVHCSGMQFEIIIHPSEKKRQAGKLKPGTGAFSAPTVSGIAVNQKVMLEELRETLEQIAALCPQHSVFNREEADNDNNAAGDAALTPCRLEDFALVPDASGEILHFSCRRSLTGVCAGSVPLACNGARPGSTG
ncbi:MAG: hypothetical protein ONB48_14850 [candidate division KSB1 bacterium]|nr:hypothetical protein [candidate division KSB1 bacterium]MDZ7286925.1 hypothetical protein [candidate division KSB1 bacterium]MDZ7299722.1 hypothetical protein [candidate division KSB1 bacterium]MDZ7305661.1 hypothetical protein [candidate division KSB1 bacterium]MDZ7350701.1 hypothetical protein [candidate division KSB1 bacterium]